MRILFTYVIVSVMISLNTGAGAAPLPPKPPDLYTHPTVGTLQGHVKGGKNYCGTRVIDIGPLMRTTDLRKNDLVLSVDGQQTETPTRLFESIVEARRGQIPIAKVYRKNRVLHCKLTLATGKWPVQEE